MLVNLLRVFKVFNTLMILELVKSDPLKYFRKNHLKTLQIFIFP
jgi:hypothetical protein